MSRSSGAPVVGAIGLGLALVAALVAFVVAMEYDPDAAAFLDRAQIGVGTIVAVDDAAERVTIAVDDGSVPDAEISPAARWFGVLEPGDTVTVAYRLDRPAGIRLRDDLPQTPRTATGFVAAAVIFGLGAAAVSAEPSVLYPRGRSHE